MLSEVAQIPNCSKLALNDFLVNSVSCARSIIFQVCPVQMYNWIKCHYLFSMAF